MRCRVLLIRRIFDSYGDKAQQMITQEKCPGSCEDNPHNLSVFSETTGNKICENSRCYFQIQYKDNTGMWQGNFDPLKVTTFVKPSREDMIP